MSRFNKHFLWIGVLLLALALVAPTAQAAEPRTGERVTIAANETVNDDVYLFGSDVIVDGTVHGDVVTAAQTVIINGTVDGSVWAAGSSITNDVPDGALGIGRTRQTNKPGWVAARTGKLGR